MSNKYYPVSVFEISATMQKGKKMFSARENIKIGLGEISFEELKYPISSFPSINVKSFKNGEVLFNYKGAVCRLNRFNEQNFSETFTYYDEEGKMHLGHMNISIVVR